MRRVLPLMILLLLVSFLLPPVHAENPNTFMEKFIEAFNTGDYSLIEPYMSEDLKNQFTRDYFSQIRNFTLDNYGRLNDYELTSNTTEGDLQKFEYTIHCEKGSFPVLLAYRKGELVGIALGIKARPNPVGMLLMILGSLISLGMLYYWAKRFEIAEFVMGAGISLALGIILPFYSIITLGMGRFAGILTVALLTSLTVEVSKYYFSRGRDGLSLGLGFGFGKYVFLAVGTFVATNFILKLPVSFAGEELYAFLGALVFTTFHAISAMLYSEGRLSYLALFVTFEFPALALISMDRAPLAIAIVTIAFLIGFHLGGGRRHGIT